MKKILIISYEFPPLLGGAGVFAREMAIGFSYHGYNPVIITCYHDSKEHNDDHDRELFNLYGIEIKRFYPHKKIFWMSMHYNIRHYLGKSYERDFEHIYLIDSRATRYSMLFMNKYQLAKSIHIFHGSEYEQFHHNPNINNRVLRLLGKTTKILKKSKSILTVSSQLKENWESAYPFLEGKIHHILNGIDEKLFFPGSDEKKKIIRDKYGFSKDDFIIISASRLIMEKGQDLLIESLPEVLKYQNKVKIIIAGDGKDKKYLEDLSLSLGIDKNISFVGKISRWELSEIMASSDLFVLPSRIKYEGFGLVYIEANACGIPVVAGNTGGVVDAVQHMESGLIVDPENQDALTKAIIKMLDSDYRKALGRQAHERFLRTFTSKKMVERILDYVSKS